MNRLTPPVGELELIDTDGMIIGVFFFDLSPAKNDLVFIVVEGTHYPERCSSTYKVLGLRHIGNAHGRCADTQVIVEKAP